MTRADRITAVAIDLRRRASGAMDAAQVLQQLPPLIRAAREANAHRAISVVADIVWFVFVDLDRAARMGPP